MLFVLTVLTAGYFAVVCWVRWSAGRRSVPDTLAVLPEEDLPPVSAVGWPPQGARFTRYVDEGFAALDAYLEEGFAA